MDDAKKYKIPLDSPLDVNSNDMPVRVDSPKFSFNRQTLLVGFPQNSVRWEQDGWAAGWYIHDFTKFTAGDYWYSPEDPPDFDSTDKKNTIISPRRLLFNNEKYFQVRFNGVGRGIAFTTEAYPPIVIEGTLISLQRIGDPLIHIEGVTTGNVPFSADVDVYTGAVVTLVCSDPALQASGYIDNESYYFQLAVPPDPNNPDMIQIRYGQHFNNKQIGNFLYQWNGSYSEWTGTGFKVNWGLPGTATPTNDAALTILRFNHTGKPPNPLAPSDIQSGNGFFKVINSTINEENKLKEEFIVDINTVSQYRGTLKLYTQADKARAFLTNYQNLRNDVIKKDYKDYGYLNFGTSPSDIPVPTPVNSFFPGPVVQPVTNHPEVEPKNVFGKTFSQAPYSDDYIYAQPIWIYYNIPVVFMHGTTQNNGDQYLYYTEPLNVDPETGIPQGGYQHTWYKYHVPAHQNHISFHLANSQMLLQNKYDLLKINPSLWPGYPTNHNGPSFGLGIMCFGNNGDFRFEAEKNMNSACIRRFFSSSTMDGLDDWYIDVQSYGGNNFWPCSWWPPDEGVVTRDVRTGASGGLLWKRTYRPWYTWRVIPHYKSSPAPGGNVSFGDDNVGNNTVEFDAVKNEKFKLLYWTTKDQQSKWIPNKRFSGGFDDFTYGKADGCEVIEYRYSNQIDMSKGDDPPGGSPRVVINDSIEPPEWPNIRGIYCRIRWAVCYGYAWSRFRYKITDLFNDKGEVKTVNWLYDNEKDTGAQVGNAKTSYLRIDDGGEIDKDGNNAPARPNPPLWYGVLNLVKFEPIGLFAKDTIPDNITAHNKMYKWEARIQVNATTEMDIANIRADGKYLDMQNNSQTLNIAENGGFWPSWSIGPCPNIVSRMGTQTTLSLEVQMEYLDAVQPVKTTKETIAQLEIPAHVPFMKDLQAGLSNTDIELIKHQIAYKQRVEVFLSGDSTGGNIVYIFDRDARTWTKMSQVFLYIQGIYFTAILKG